MKNPNKPSNPKKEKHRVVISTSKVHNKSMVSNEATIDFSKYMKQGENSQNRWLNHLSQKPLLQLMNDELSHFQTSPIDATELNCFERLKKLLSMQNGNKCGEKISQSNEKILNNVASLEGQMNKLEQTLKSTNSHNLLKTTKLINAYKYSQSASKRSSFFNKNKDTVNQSLTNSIKDYEYYQPNPKTTEIKICPLKGCQVKKSIKFQIEKLKKNSCQHFINHKKSVDHKIFTEIQQFINLKIEEKIDDLISRKVTEYQALKDQSQNFNQILYQKELQIESLLKEVRYKDEKIRSKLQDQQPHQGSTYQTKSQLFYGEFQAAFGTTSIKDLKKKIESMENMYINKYSKAEGEHLSIYSQLKREKQQLKLQLIQKDKRYEQRELQFYQIERRHQKYSNLDNSWEKHEIFQKIPEYKQKISQLENLENYIMNKYVEWLNCRSQTEEKLVNALNSSLVGDYEYMIDKMVYFNQNFLTNDKGIQYITKLVNNIVRVKKQISIGKMHERVEPFKALDQIEAYIKNTKFKRPKKTNFFNRTKDSSQYLTASNTMIV